MVSGAGATSVFHTAACSEPSVRTGDERLACVPGQSRTALSGASSMVASRACSNILLPAAAYAGITPGPNTNQMLRWAILFELLLMRRGFVHLGTNALG
jgi:hypothetical protein